MSSSLTSAARAVFVATTIALCGCHGDAGGGPKPGNTETAGADDVQSANQIGVYPPAPDVANHPKVGVPPFNIKGTQSYNVRNMTDMAADEATTLLTEWGGFSMIERTQMDQLFKEQGMAGIDPNEAAKQGKIHGIDLMLMGRITNFKVSTKKHTGGGGYGGFSKRTTTITKTVSCGIDLRLVDTTTGSIACATQSDFHQSTTSQSSESDMAGVRRENDNSTDTEEDDHGELLRFALDDAIRKSCPKFSAFVTKWAAAHPAPAGTPAAAPASSAAPIAPADQAG